MKLSRGDLALLKLPLLSALMAVTLSGLLVWWSLLDGATATQAYETAAKRKRQSEHTLQQMERDAAERQQLADQLSRQTHTRHPHQENRLAWTETLAQIGRDLQLLEMHYEFGPQSSLGTIKSAAHGWLASPMKLQLRLRHEQELLDFLQHLKQQAKAMILVRQCTLSTEPDVPGLAATCELAWVTSAARNDPP